jgi:hypothetical protein
VRQPDDLRPSCLFHGYHPASEFRAFMISLLLGLLLQKKCGRRPAQILLKYTHCMQSTTIWRESDIQ